MGQNQTIILGTFEYDEKLLPTVPVITFHITGMCSYFASCYCMFPMPDSSYNFLKEVAR